MALLVDLLSFANFTFNLFHLGSNIIQLLLDNEKRFHVNASFMIYRPVVSASKVIYQFDKAH